MLNYVVSNIKKACNFCNVSQTPASYIEVERAEQTFYINYLREGMTAFDVGANVGEISLLFSRFVGINGHVHSFEPCGNTFERLCKICSLANRQQILLNHLAVSENEGLSSLNVYDEVYSGWNTLAERHLEMYGIDVKPIQVENVRTISIDRYCREKNITHIDLLKIDVEGAEYQVLLGARQMLEQKRVGCCVFEFGATTFDMGNTPTMIEYYLKQVGYSIRNVVPGKKCFPGRDSAMSAKFAIHIAEPK